MMRPMPHDGHDHPHHHGDAPCTRSALALAEAQCAETGARLTPLRRRVLEIVAGAGRPIGAYDVIDVMAATGGERPAPITVYRALDFLMDQALVHRLSSRNAFFACNHSHGEGDTVAFLICDACGGVSELAEPKIMASISEAATARGFVVSRPIIEISGTCAGCAGH